MQTMSSLAQAIFPCPFVLESDHDLITDADPLALAAGGLGCRNLEEASDRPGKAWNWLFAH